MVVSKSGPEMDYWRKYFRSANANIFEIIEGAIMLAASDCPKEFQNRRDGIAQILFNCKLIKCSACHKEELALPVEDVNGNCSKESSKVIDSYGDAEALTDELEQESQTLGEVMRIKRIVDNSPDESASVLCDSLRKLQLMAISIGTLKATEIGKSVNVLRKHSSKDVRQIARTLIQMWKDTVDEWMDASKKMTVSEAIPESMNPSDVDEEEGLPSPPLDDLAFLNPHSMSLELNEFFDGMDDYGNPRNNGGKPPVQRNSGGKLPVWKRQKLSNGPNMVPKPTVVKPSKPGRLMKPNMDRKLQNIEKPILLKRLVASQQHKLSSNEETVQDKFGATKRKLPERY